jgi:AcrR family transcriptional regulator
VSSTTENSPKRTYRLGARAEAAQRTREAILDGGERAFADRWYDEVTLADVAREAGVSQQTVVNHFGSKENLYLCGLTERFAPRVAAGRSGVVVGDTMSVVQTVVDDYEETGLGTIRVLALAERHPTLAEVTRNGRRYHRGWVADALEPRLAGRTKSDRDRVVRLLTTALDVRTWYQLRHEEGRSVAETRQDLRRLVEALLADHG